MEKDHGSDLFMLLTAMLIILMIAISCIWYCARNNEMNDEKAVLVSGGGEKKCMKAV